MFFPQSQRRSTSTIQGLFLLSSERWILCFFSHSLFSVRGEGLFPPSGTECFFPESPSDRDFPSSVSFSFSPFPSLFLYNNIQQAPWAIECFFCDFVPDVFARHFFNVIAFGRFPVIGLSQSWTFPIHIGGMATFFLNGWENLLLFDFPPLSSTV